MSSATSIDRRVRVKPERVRAKSGAPRPHKPVEAAHSDADAGFRPWHFFVLASLIAATAAVVMARQSTPEHLVLLSLTIGAAGAAGAGFYRMLAPLAVEDVTLFSEPLTERQRAALEREKTLVLRSIKELEFDRAMGKLSQKDFDEMGGRLRARALSLMKEVDAGGSGYREIIERELRARLAARPHDVVAKPAVTVADGPMASVAVSARTCTCGTANDADASFCKRCGTRLS